MEQRVRTARCKQRSGDVLDRSSDFLQAYDVPRLTAHEPMRESLALRGADAVDVEGDDAHRRTSSSERGRSLR